jgi:uncharacterized protein YcfJ
MDVFNRINSRSGRRTLIAGCAVFAAASSLPAMAEVYTNDDGQRVECHYETSKSDEGHPIAAPVIGAVAGGVVGHQIGSGRGNDVATVAGAGAGAYAGKKYNDNKTDDRNTTKKVCHPVD